MSSTDLRVVIVGARIGGLTLALLLRQRGIAAEVVEQAPELREAGAAIALASNATRVPQHIGLGRDGRYEHGRRMLNAGLNVGLTPAEVVEALLHAAVYCGLPRALSATFVAKKVFAEQTPAREHQYRVGAIRA